MCDSLGGAKIQGEDDAYDFGSGAGFYVDATAEPWSKNYRMYTYVTRELPEVVFQKFPQLDSSRISITGHSMGGHGALSLYLKNPGMYKSVSAFAPIANPLKCPWGEKAFKGYFGEQDWQTKGAEHDSTELLKKWKGGDLDILIDVVRPPHNAWEMLAREQTDVENLGDWRQLLQAEAAVTGELCRSGQIDRTGEGSEH